MKRSLLVLSCAAIALSMVVPATAVEIAWFRVNSATGPGIGALTDVLTTQGGPGVTPVIDKPNLPGVYTFDMTLVADLGPDGSKAWSVDLLGSLATTMASAAYANAPFSFMGNDDPINIGAAPLLLDNAGQFSITFPAVPFTVGVHDLLNFTITINKGALGNHNIDFGIGGGGWGNPAGGFETVAVGGNAPISGDPLSSPPLVTGVIINNVPEPATLALLGLGAFGLIRRRR